MLSVTALDSILKSYYLDAVCTQLNTGASPLYSKIEKTGVSVSGKNAVVPVVYGICGGLEAVAEDASLPDAYSSLHVALSVPLRNLYGTVEITDKALRVARDSVDGVTDILTSEIQAMITSARYNINRMIWGDGSGQLTTISDLTGHTAKNWFPVESTAKLTEGMVVDVMRSSTAVIKALRISYVDNIGNKVYFSTSVPTATPLAKDDILYVHNSNSTEVNGIPYIFGSTSSYYGISKTLHPWLGGTSKDLSATLSTDVMQEFLDNLEIGSGHKVDMIVCGNDVRRQYLKYLQTSRSNIDYMNVDGGFKTLSYNGIPLDGDRFCPSGEMYFLDTDSLKMVQLCDWEWLEGTDKAILNKVPGKASYQAILVKYANFVSLMPRAVGRLHNITVA